MDVRRLAEMMSATLSEDKNQRDAAEEQLKQVNHFRQHTMCSWNFFQVSLLKIGDLHLKLHGIQLRFESFCVESDKNVPNNSFNRTLFHRFPLSEHFCCLNNRRNVSLLYI